MKTSILQSFFKIALLLSVLVAGAGCSNDDELAEFVEWKDADFSLEKVVLEGEAVDFSDYGDCIFHFGMDNRFHAYCALFEIEGTYKESNGNIKIKDLKFTISKQPDSPLEALIINYFSQITSFKYNKKNGKMQLKLGKENCYLECQRINDLL